MMRPPAVDPVGLCAQGHRQPPGSPSQGADAVPLLQRTRLQEHLTQMQLHARVDLRHSCDVQAGPHLNLLHLPLHLAPVPECLSPWSCCCPLLLVSSLVLTVQSRHMETVPLQGVEVEPKRGVEAVRLLRGSAQDSGLLPPLPPLDERPQAPTPAAAAHLKDRLPHVGPRPRQAAHLLRHPVRSPRLLPVLAGLRGVVVAESVHSERRRSEYTVGPVRPPGRKPTPAPSACLIRPFWMSSKIFPPMTPRGDLLSNTPQGT